MCGRSLRTWRSWDSQGLIPRATRIKLHSLFGDPTSYKPGPPLVARAETNGRLAPTIGQLRRVWNRKGVNRHQTRPVSVVELAQEE